MTVDLARRTDALDEAVRAATGRLDPALLDEARDVVGRVRERAGLSAEHTVVALAGATGSGKSSVFNALAGAELAEVGVRRPTTSRALAALWPAGEGTDPGPLLDWLEVRRRHEMTTALTSGALPGTTSDAAPGTSTSLTQGGGLLRRRRRAPETSSGLVLLDLPDHDSVVTEHRVRAERLVERADLLVWVVDPQKYADAALHERYLRPLAGHGAVVVVVLNQVDRLTPPEVEACLADLRRLVAQDGVAGARVLGVSTRTGEGMDGLRALLSEAAARREAANARLVADERAVAARVLDACGDLPSSRAVERAHVTLVDALEAAAQVPTVVAAVRTSAARDARAATGWPVTRWIGRFRRDPLGRLGLRAGPAPGSRAARAAKALGPGGAAAGPEGGGSGRPVLARTSLPAVAAATRAGAQSAVRDYVRTATQGVAEPWALATRDRATTGTRDLADALDGAVAGTTLEEGRRPVWWRVVGAVQWLALGALVAGLAWLGGLALMAYLRLPEPPTPVWGEVPWPTVLVLGGLGAGVLLALVSRVVGSVGARRRARRAGRRLRAAVEQVAERLVVGPVAEEMAALERCRAAASTAAG